LLVFVDFLKFFGFDFISLFILLSGILPLKKSIGNTFCHEKLG
jgi:hypothetical protein